MVLEHGRRPGGGPVQADRRQRRHAGHLL